jgi:hypothetical protein
LLELEARKEVSHEPYSGGSKIPSKTTSKRSNMNRTLDPKLGGSKIASKRAHMLEASLPLNL